MKVFLLITLATFASAAVVEPLVPLAKPVFVGDIRPSRIGRISNGYPANRDQFPHQASITLPVSQTQSVVCGGAIITDNFILTAAHCVVRNPVYRIGVGSINLQSPTIRVESTTSRYHPSYNPSNLNNDIGLIELPIRLTWTNSIQPVQLPTRSQQGNSFEFERTYVSGFGKTTDNDPSVQDALRYVYQRVISNSECSAIYGSDVIRSFTLCGRGWDFNAQSICEGDSGGPMILYDQSVESTIIGVASFVSSRGCVAGDPAGYTRVTSYLDWISQNAGIQIRP